MIKGESLTQWGRKYHYSVLGDFLKMLPSCKIHPKIKTMFSHLFFITFLLSSHNDRLEFHCQMICLNTIYFKHTFNSLSTGADSTVHSQHFIESWLDLLTTLFPIFSNLISPSLKSNMAFQHVSSANLKIYDFNS